MKCFFAKHISLRFVVVVTNI